jgi:hypothetical protein
MKMKAQPTRTYGTGKEMLRGKVYSHNVYVKNTDLKKENDLILHLKLL